MAVALANQNGELSLADRGDRGLVAVTPVQQPDQPRRHLRLHLPDVAGFGRVRHLQGLALYRERQLLARRKLEQYL